MNPFEKPVITVYATIAAPIERVWKVWTTPADIVKWNNASDDWHTPRAENDLREGGRFSYRMEAKDGSMGFDFWGIYDKVIFQEQIDYTMGDGRRTEILFSSADGKTTVIESFEAESENSLELQQFGWQAILDNLKKYAEAGIRI